MCLCLDNWRLKIRTVNLSYVVLGTERSPPSAAEYTPSGTSTALIHAIT